MLRRALAYTLCLATMFAPVSLIDQLLTRPALEAQCAALCQDRGAQMTAFKRSWVRSKKNSCWCGKEKIPYSPTTWWALFQGFVFLASLPVGILLLHRVDPSIRRQR